MKGGTMMRMSHAALGMLTAIGGMLPDLPLGASAQIHEAHNRKGSHSRKGKPNPPGTKLARRAAAGTIGINRRGW